MSWKVLLGLVVCNAIWAGNPVMGKILMRDFAPLQVSWIRYSSALLGTFLAVALLSRAKPALLGKFSQVKNAAIWPWIIAMGIITFFGSAVLQYKGLAQSTSTANAIIIALEPLFAVILAWIFLGETTKLNQAGAFVLATAGFLLLSNVKPSNIVGTLALFNFGNFLILMCLPMEAMYSVISRKLGGRLEPIPVFALSLPIGFLCLTSYLLYSGIPLPDLGKLSFQGFLAMLWMGPLGTAASYIFWTVALMRAPVMAVSLTLFVQPILGAIFGIAFLGERLDFWQLVGATCIVGALVMQTALTYSEEKNEATSH